MQDNRTQKKIKDQKRKTFFCSSCRARSSRARLPTSFLHDTTASGDDSCVGHIMQLDTEGLEGGVSFVMTLRFDKGLSYSPYPLAQAVSVQTLVGR